MHKNQANAQEPRPTYDDLTRVLEETFEPNEKENSRQYVDVTMDEEGWTVTMMYFHIIPGNPIREAIGLGFQLDSVERTGVAIKLQFSYWGQIDEANY